MKASVHLAKPEHEIAYQDMIALLRRNDKLSAIEMLAIAANMVGKLMAYQDQRTVTPKMAIRVVSENIERGNAQAIAEVANSKGSA